MKFYLVYIFIILLSYNIVGQTDMNVGVHKEGSELVVSITYDGSTPSGMVGGLPSTNDYMSDFTVTIKWPSIVDLNLGPTITSTLGSNVIIKVGTEIIQGSDEFQRFRLNSSVQIPSNLVAGVPFEIFRISYTAVNAGASDNAEIAPLGYLPVGNGGLQQPNTGIDYDGSGDVVDFLPMDITEFAPLPITLKSFDAKKHSSSSAKLDWTTSKEVNSDYFGIERSIDGSTWDEIARVKAAGDSNLDIAYDYIDDRLPLSRTNGQVFYYRLRMTDLDGAFKYSDVRGVNFDKQALGPISIYPNPTTEIVNIDLSEVVMEDGDVYVSVYDMSGRLVMTKQIIGSGIELIKVDQLPSDAYNFIIRQGEQIHQQRVIKID